MRKALVGLIAAIYLPISIWGQTDSLPRHNERWQELSTQQTEVVAGHDEMASLAGAEERNPSKAGPDSAFDWIKSLAGEWEGSFKWTGGRSGQGKMNAMYYVTGNGSAVVEDLIVTGKPFMTSVYHRDGATLRMTHYCAGGNQPRLKASTIDEGNKAIRFELVDITNV